MGFFHSQRGRQISGSSLEYKEGKEAAHGMKFIVIDQPLHNATQSIRNFNILPITLTRLPPKDVSGNHQGSMGEGTAFFLLGFCNSVRLLLQSPDRENLESPTLHRLINNEMFKLFAGLG